MSNPQIKLEHSGATTLRPLELAVFQAGLANMPPSGVASGIIQSCLEKAVRDVGPSPDVDQECDEKAQMIGPAVPPKVQPGPGDVICEMNQYVERISAILSHMTIHLVDGEHIEELTDAAFTEGYGTSGLGDVSMIAKLDAQYVKTK